MERSNWQNNPEEVDSQKKDLFLLTHPFWMPLSAAHITTTPVRNLALFHSHGFRTSFSHSTRNQFGPSSVEHSQSLAGQSNISASRTILIGTLFWLMGLSNYVSICFYHFTLPFHSQPARCAPGWPGESEGEVIVMGWMGNMLGAKWFVALHLSRYASDAVLLMIIMNHLFI